MTLLVAVLVGLAVATLGLRRPSRLSDVLQREAAPRASVRLSPRVACLVAGLAVLLVVRLPAGAVLALVLALLGPRVLSRLEPREAREHREQLTADLPLVLDLLAACLAGGAPLPAAAAVVADAVGGPCRSRLQQVVAALAVGSAPGDAWACLGSGDDPLAPAARSLARATEGGGAVAAVIGRLAADARAVASAQGERRARQAGVLAVAPLGLCFLPAFVLLGVVPVVAGLAGPLLATLR